jgi:adhesin HecA-like repeat protein
LGPKGRGNYLFFTLGAKARGNYIPCFTGNTSTLRLTLRQAYFGKLSTGDVTLRASQLSNQAGAIIAFALLNAKHSIHWN